MKKLLMLHGAVGSTDQFKGLAESLSQDYEICLMNFSGHGGSELPEEFSIARFANDVIGYLEKNGVATVDIFGYSMGGYVALYLARYYPEKVGRIFTLATKFAWTPEPSVREAKMLDADKISEKLPGFASVLEQRHQPADWKQLLKLTAQMMISMGKDNPLKDDDFKNIKSPVRLAVGDRDQMVSVDETLHVFRLAADASFVVMPSTQHPIEKVDRIRLAQELRWFFN